MRSPYLNKDVKKWGKITNNLIKKHPLNEEKIVETVLKSWDDIFKSKIGSFNIGKEIFPSPQIMSFLLHELVAHYLTINHPGIFRVGVEKSEKDIHCITDEKLSVEIKGSSHTTQIFGNRSYAQPTSGPGQKSKDGYYITINFEKFKKGLNRRPEILIIRFGYLEHTDWIAQKAATGQQARLPNEVYSFKLKILYENPRIKKE